MARVIVEGPSGFIDSAAIDGSLTGVKEPGKPFKNDMSGVRYNLQGNRGMVLFEKEEDITPPLSNFDILTEEEAKILGRSADYQEAE